jgi:hypothetical protein
LITSISLPLLAKLMKKGKAELFRLHDMVVPPCLIDRKSLQERVKLKCGFRTCAVVGNSELQTTSRLQEQGKLWQEKNIPTGRGTTIGEDLLAKSW